MAISHPKDYKQLALALLEHFDKITQEHRAMRELLKHYPALEKDFLTYMPHAKQTVDSVFVPLRTAMESGIGVKPALEALSKLHWAFSLNPSPCIPTIFAQRKKQMAFHPKFSQQTFNHMRRLIQTVKDRAETQLDVATGLDAELLDALLLRFVEDLIAEGSITVQDVKV
jgi:hypothetical protein